MSNALIINKSGFSKIELLTNKTLSQPQNSSYPAPIVKNTLHKEVISMGGGQKLQLIYGQLMLGSDTAEAGSTQTVSIVINNETITLSSGYRNVHSSYTHQFIKIFDEPIDCNDVTFQFGGTDDERKWEGKIFFYGFK